MKKLIIIALAVLSMGFALTAFADQGFYLNVTDTNTSPYYITGVDTNEWNLCNLPSQGCQIGPFKSSQSFYTESQYDTSSSYGNNLYVGLVSLGSNENSSITPYYVFLFCNLTGSAYWNGGSLYSFQYSSNYEYILQNLNQSNCSVHWDDGYGHFYYGWYLNGSGGTISYPIDSSLTVSGTLSPY